MAGGKDFSGRGDLSPGNEYFLYMKPLMNLLRVGGLLLFATVLYGQTITVEAAQDDLDLDYAHVIKAVASKQGESWRFAVTVRHGDEGWDHYADRWVVVNAATGEEYGRRVLAHPHVSEQPFTRSQSGIRIPARVEAVLVKAACGVHGFGGTELRLELP